MKKIKRILLVILVLTTFSVNAQFKFGVAGGFNYSEIQGHVLPNDPIFGGNVGVISDYKIGKTKLKVELDLLFSQKGGNFGPITAGNGSFISNDFKLVSNYVELPLVLKYDWPRRFYRMNLQAGLQYSYLIGAKADGLKLEKNNFNSNEFSVVVGTGWDGDWFHMSTRYIIGLNTIYSNNSKGKNELIVVSFGYWIK